MLTLSDRIWDKLLVWFETGTAGFEGQTKRRLVVINVLMTVIPIFTIIYILALCILDFWGFLYPIIFLSITAPMFLITPYLWPISIWAGTIYNLVFWIFVELVLSFLLGRESGIHFMFLAGATASILIFGVRVNRMSLISLMTGVACFNLANRLFLEHSPFVTASAEDVARLFFVSITIFVLNTFCLIYYAFYQVHKAERALEREFQYSENLLTAMMPQSIADQLKHDRKKQIADSYDQVTILFADLAGFTARSSIVEPRDVVDFLNKLFTKLDELAHKHGVEKIKTLGDGYMAAAGLPVHVEDHAARIADFALDSLKAARALSDEMNEEFRLRIGFHTGPAVAGVLSAEKPFYDVWGDTVNIASRLESEGVLDRIQVTSGTKKLLEDLFHFEKRGKVELKGKGAQEVWLLTGRK